MANELFARKQLYIVDGYALIYRSYFAMISAPIKDGEGKNVSAVYGFFKTVMKLLKEYHPDYLVVALDSRTPTFRHDLYPLYKANREKAPDDLHAQVPVIEHILDEMAVPYLMKDGFEADDIIATLCDEAAKKEIDSVIFTGDKDLLQLVDSHVSALRPPKPKTNNYRMFHEKEVEEEFGVAPERIIDYLSLIGDSSDNVPGVTGIGPVGAVKLVKQYGTVENIYAHIAELPKGMQTKLEQAKGHMELTRTLIDLKHDIFTVDSFDTPQYKVDDIDYGKAAQVFDSLKLPSLAKEALSFGGKSTVEVELPKGNGKRGTYKGVTDMGELSYLLEGAMKAGDILAFDTETDSVDEMEANLLGFSFAYEEGKAWYVPVTKENLGEVKGILSLYLPQFRIVGQNIKFDKKVLDHHGIAMGPLYFDTMIAAWLLDSAGRAFNLDFLADRYLDYKTIHYEEAVPKGKTIADIPLEQAKEYGGEDSDLALRLYHLFSTELSKRGLTDLMANLEMPLVPILATMEENGIILDTQRIGKLDTLFASLIDASSAKIYAFAGKEFNLNSPAQLSDVLFVEQQIPPGAKTLKGFSTSSDVLEPLAAKYPIVEEILSYRQISKLKNTYIDTLPTMVDRKTGRIHPHFLQTGTETGRLSCNNPNLQNIPVRSEEGRKIRGAFVPREGCVFLSADYSQIELVVLAHMAQDKELMDAFRRGEDIHRSTAAKVFQVFPEFVTDEQRRIAKTINFGVVYGISAHNLSQTLGITHAEAKHFIDGYFATYHGVADYIQATHELASKQGYVTTLLGHRREIKEINSANKTEKAKAERIAVNTVIQGSAADIVKMAMLSVAKELEKRGLSSKLLLQIHDELLFEVPKGEVEEMKGMVRGCMEGAYRLSIPLKVSIETADDWGLIH